MPHYIDRSFATTSNHIPEMINLSIFHISDWKYNNCHPFFFFLPRSSPRSSHQSYAEYKKSRSQTLNNNGSTPLPTLHKPHSNGPSTDRSRLPPISTPPASPRDHSDSAVNGHDMTRPFSSRESRPTRGTSSSGSDPMVPDSGNGSLNAIHSSPTPVNDVPTLNLRSVTYASSDSSLGKFMFQALTLPILRLILS